MKTYKLVLQPNDSIITIDNSQKENEAIFIIRVFSAEDLDNQNYLSFFWDGCQIMVERLVTDNHDLTGLALCQLHMQNHLTRIAHKNGLYFIITQVQENTETVIGVCYSLPLPYFPLDNYLVNEIKKEKYNGSNYAEKVRAWIYLCYDYITSSLQYPQAQQVLGQYTTSFLPKISETYPIISNFQRVFWQVATEYGYFATTVAAPKTKDYYNFKLNKSYLFNEKSIIIAPQADSFMHFGITPTELVSTTQHNESVFQSIVQQIKDTPINIQLSFKHMHAFQKKISPATSTIKFSKKELQCLRYLLEGKTAKETAEVLHLSPRTVEAYLLNIKHKTLCYTKAELICYALRLNLNEL
jgi:DNA-binding CsgD family transcriptional regulator